MTLASRRRHFMLVLPSAVILTLLFLAFSQWPEGFQIWESSNSSDSSRSEGEGPGAETKLEKTKGTTNPIYESRPLEASGDLAGADDGGVPGDASNPGDGEEKSSKEEVVNSNPAVVEISSPQSSEDDSSADSSRHYATEKAASTIPTEISTPSDDTTLYSSQNPTTDQGEGIALAAKKGMDPLNTTFPRETNETKGPLTPPFHVAQLGIPGTGSTFQFRLLDLLARLKSPNGTEISTEFLSGERFHEAGLASKQPNSSFIFKSHDWKLIDFWNKFETVGGVVFASADLESQHLVKFAEYIQLKENLANCSLCEVDQYKHRFALTEKEVDVVKRYMRLYEKIRLCCCGRKMSEYNVMKLNGCNTTEYLGKPSCPHCEDYDMEDVEEEFLGLGLPYTVMTSDSLKNWVKPSNCAKFDGFTARVEGCSGKVSASREDSLFGGQLPQQPTTVTKWPSTVSSMEKKDEVEKRSHEEEEDVGGVQTTIAPVGERLKPPFRVVQLGVPRTGSTFQFRLLDVLVRMKSPESKYKIITQYVESYEDHDRLLARNSYVLKSHKYNQPERFKKAQTNRRLVVFATADAETQHLVNFSDYIQLKEDLENCSLCEVDKYQDLFGLTQDEINLVKSYMGLFEKIRKCCGTQMSKFNAMRLNGCNMTEYKDLPGYPHCEDYNFSRIEEDFDSLPLPYTVFSGDSLYNWQRPGDCAKFDKRVASGVFFNTERFTTCEDALTWRAPPLRTASRSANSSALL